MVKDSKTDALVLRLNPSLKKELQKLADSDRRKLSDYVRLQLEKIVAKSNKV